MSENDFRDQLLQGFWHDLKQHLERDAIIVVDPDLDLHDVAVHVEQDRAAVIQDWISKKLIAKPSAEQIRSWNEMPTKEFSFLIVQPYVLIQERGH